MQTLAQNMGRNLTLSVGNECLLLQGCAPERRSSCVSILWAGKIRPGILRPSAAPFLPGLPLSWPPFVSHKRTRRIATLTFGLKRAWEWLSRVPTAGSISREESQFMFAGEYITGYCYFEQEGALSRPGELARPRRVNRLRQIGRIHGNLRHSGKHRSRYCPVAAGARAAEWRSSDGAEKKGRQTKESGSSDCPQEGGSCRKARQEKETESLTRRAEADRGSGQAPLGEATQGR